MSDERILYVVMLLMKSFDVDYPPYKIFAENKKAGIAGALVVYDTKEAALKAGADEGQILEIMVKEATNE